VEDDVDPVHRPVEPVAVADVADEEADVAPVLQPLALVELLRLVPAEDPDDRRIALEEPLDEPGADRAGAARDEDSRAAERSAGGDRRSSVGRGGRSERARETVPEGLRGSSGT
jgi:hypothetical protein